MTTRGAKVCVAGELFWDLHADGPLERASRFERVMGGAAANVAQALCDRGVPVAVAGVVGDDVMGRGLRDGLDGAGIDTSALSPRPGQTGCIFISPFRDGGHRFFSYRSTATWPKHPRLPEPWRRGSLEGRVLHVAAVNPDELEVMERLAARVVARGGQVTFDLNARPRAWLGLRMTRSRLAALCKLLAHACWVKASEEDLGAMGVAGQRETLGLSPQALLVVTRGPRPMTLSLAEGEARMRPVRVDAPWSVGAGDAFSAALVARCVEQRPGTLREWRRAVRVASVAAAEHLQRAAPK